MDNEIKGYWESLHQSASDYNSFDWENLMIDYGQMPAGNHLNAVVKETLESEQKKEAMQRNFEGLLRLLHCGMQGI